MQMKLKADGAVAQAGNAPVPRIAGLWKDVEPGVAFVGIVNRSVVLTVTLKALEYRRCSETNGPAHITGRFIKKAPERPHSHDIR